MMTFQSLTLDALCDRLAVKKNTLIVFHARPDADGISDIGEKCHADNARKQQNLTGA